MGIKELLNADAEPRTQFGEGVWANKWEIVTKNYILTIENPSANH